jgi:hypothetical protein
MNSALINWFHLAKKIDFEQSPVPDKQMQVLSETLDTSKLSIEDFTEISEEEFEGLEDFFETSDDERGELLQKTFLSVPCQKVTILHSYTEEGGFLRFTLNQPTYHQIMEALMSASICGFDGDVLVHGNATHGVIEV